MISVCALLVVPVAAFWAFARGLRYTVAAGCAQALAAEFGVVGAGLLFTEIADGGDGIAAGIACGFVAAIAGLAAVYLKRRASRRSWQSAMKRRGLAGYPPTREGFIVALSVGADDRK